MDFLGRISIYIVPLLILFIVGYGLWKKKNAYDEFIKGAEDGFRIVIKILPTLIGLMVAVSILRASGAMEALGRLITPITSLLKFPSELVPLVIVKAFSSSAATGLLLDIYKTYGTDGFIGRLASVILSCTETIFYTMSVYFMTAGVKKTRYTLAGAIIATVAGIMVSTLLVSLGG